MDEELKAARRVAQAKKTSKASTPTKPAKPETLKQEPEKTEPQPIPVPTLFDVSCVMEIASSAPAKEPGAAAQPAAAVVADYWSGKRCLK